MKKKLNLILLTSLVLNSILGAGIFSLPQNIAKVSSQISLLISWTITGIGIFLLASTMLILIRIRPDLEGGIFAYFYEGFGNLIGFCSAWGYWLSTIIANVFYLENVFSALSFFIDTPSIHFFGNGDTWQSTIGASLLLWFIHYLILHDVKIATNINLIATIAKLVPLSLFIILAIFTFRQDLFSTDFNGIELGLPIWKQVKNTMLITLWVFIGIEGAVVVSARAHNKRDIGRATLLAVIAALSIYFLVTILSFGIVTRQELANMRNPSMAGLMEIMIGSFGKIVIALGLIISVFGAYLSWSIMAAEVLFLVTKNYNLFPNLYINQINKHSFTLSLWLTNISVQFFLILSWMTSIDYNMLLAISSEMILVPYFLIAAFLLKAATRSIHYVVGTGSCIYSLWLLYAADIMYLLLSIILYIPGILIFISTRYIDRFKKLKI